MHAASHKSPPLNPQNRQPEKPPNWSIRIFVFVYKLARRKYYSLGAQVPQFAKALNSEE